MANCVLPEPPANHIIALLKKLSLRRSDLAAAMGVSRPRVTQLLNGRTSLSPEFALRLAKVTQTKPEFWLGLQNDFHLAQARKELAAELDRLAPLQASPSQKVENAE